jgi:DNA repair protein RadC
MSRDACTARVRNQGINAANIVDLLAVGLARRESDVAQVHAIAHRIVTQYGSLADVLKVSTTQFVEAAGLEEFEALRVQALMEIGRRAEKSSQREVRKLSNPDDVSWMLDDLRHERQEHFVALLLDASGNLIRRVDVHKGTLTASLVGPREVFREAVREGASSIIVSHNHPSGNPEPSPEDLAITKVLVEVGNILDIPVEDHVILGDRGRYVSLRKRGLIT